MPHVPLVKNGQEMPMSWGDDEVRRANVFKATANCSVSYTCTTCPETYTQFVYTLAPPKILTQEGYFEV